MNEKKNDHILIRNQKTIAKIRESAGKSENICGHLDEVIESVSKKLKRVRFENPMMREGVSMHYKATLKNKSFVDGLANEIGIDSTTCLAVIIFLDKLLMY